MKSHILPVTSNSMIILILASFLAIVSFLSVSSEVQYVLAPIAAALFIALLFWLSMSERRGELPLTDIGTITVLATVCYTIIPPLQFLLAGMEHTNLSAFQLYTLAPTPEEIGAFTWWYVVYLLSFVISYLVIDSKSRKATGNPLRPHMSPFGSLGLLFIIFSVLIYAIDLLYGINQSVIYGTEKMYSSYEALLQMPLLFRQIYGIIIGIGLIFIVKLGILLTIFLNWKKNVYRYALYAWLFLMLVSNILWMGARTELFLTFLAVVLMYHRFVNPLRFTQILAVGIILFAGFIIMGMMRGAADLGANLENFKNALDNSEHIFSTANEFQTLFGGNYDLLQMKEGGLLGEVPLQFRLYDLIMIFPQQILPFEKLDVQQWYLQQSNNPGYFMFNPISQAIIGFGWVELVFRGLFLGFVFAKVRVWYIRRASSYWATLFYFYLIIISYYTIRSTAVYLIFAYILFRFIPLYLLVAFIRQLRVRVHYSSIKER